MLGSRALEQLLSDEELGLRLDRIVHGAQKFAYTRPIKAGDDIAATATITTVRKAGDVEVIMYETALSHRRRRADRHLDLRRSRTTGRSA